jgi:hypothetical protein
MHPSLFIHCGLGCSVIDEARTFANARVWSLGNSEGGTPLDVVTFDGGKDQVCRGGPDV